MATKHKVMKKLGRANYVLISEGVKTYGTYDPNEILFLFEERLLMEEFHTVVDFLQWCHDNQMTFGSGNYELTYSKFLKQYTPTERKDIPDMKDVRPSTLVFVEPPPRTIPVEDRQIHLKGGVVITMKNMNFVGHLRDLLSDEAYEVTF